MTVENGKVVKATEIELFQLYLRKGFDDIMSFTEYKRRCVDLGTKIIESEVEE